MILIMRKPIVVIILMTFYICANAQDENAINRGAIKVEQRFNVFRDCWLGERNKPVLKTMELMINNISNSIKDCDNYSACFDIDNFYNDNDDKNFTLKMKLYAGNMRHNNNREYELFITTPGIHLSNEYENRSACGMRGAHEGFRTQTIYTIDNPITITCLNPEEARKLCIEKEQKVILKFNKFYSDANSDVKLQYQVNAGDGQSDWKNIDNCEVTSDGVVKLKYEDISDEQNYIAEKFISFRAIKKLVTGHYSSSKPIENIRFYHRGPDFEIKDVRRPICKDLCIYVEIDDDATFNDYYNYEGYSWALLIAPDQKIEEDGSNSESFVVKTQEYNNTIILEGENENKDTIQKYIENKETAAENNNNPIKKWYAKLQLKCKGDDVQGLDFVEKNFTIPTKLPKIQVEQIGPKEDNTDATKFYSKTIYEDKSEQYAVIRITDEHNRFDYTLNKKGNDDSSKRKISFDSYESSTELEYKTIDEFKSANQLDNNPLAKDYTEDIKKEWKDFYKEKYDKWFVDYCKPKKITKNNLMSYSNNGDWGDDQMDSYSLLMICSKGTAYFVWTLMGSQIGTYAIKNVSEDFVNDWYKNFNSQYHCVKDIENGKKLCLKSDQDWPMEEMELTCTGRYLNVKIKVYNYTSQETEITNFSMATDQIENTYEYIAHFGCRAVVKEVVGQETNYYQMHVCGDASDFYHNMYVSGLDKLNGFKCGIYNTHGEWVYYQNNKFIVQNNQFILPSRVIDVSDIDVKKIWYASTNYLQYEDEDDNFYEQYIGSSATPPYVDVDSWKKDFYNKKYAQYLSNEGYKLKGIEYNKKETYILTDSDGCPQEFDILVYSPAEFSVIESKSPKKWNDSSGSLKLKYIHGPKIQLEDTTNQLENTTNQYVPGDTIKLDGIPATGRLTFNIVGDDNANPIYYNYNIGHGIDVVNATYCESTQTGKIYVMVDDTITNKTFSLINSNNDTISSKTTDRSWTFDSIKSGEYSVEVSDSATSVKWPYAINVADSAFRVDSCIRVDATEIGGNGSVTVKLKNNSKGVSWNNVTLFSDIEKDKEEKTYEKVPAAEYNLTATHDYCSVTIPSFSISAPSVKFENSIITQFEDSNTINIKLEVSKQNINNYDIILYKNGSEIARGATVDTTIQYDANTYFSINLSYDNHTTVLVDKINVLSLNCSVTGDTNKRRCDKEKGEITLISDSDCEYKIDNESYKSINDKIIENHTVGLHKVSFKKEQTIISSEFGTITQIVEKNYDNVEVVSIDTLQCFIGTFDVTCKGSQDGEIKLDSVKNARGGVDFRIDYGNHEFSDYATSIKNLKPDSYNIIIRDSDCQDYPYYKNGIEIIEPEYELKIQLDTIIDPTCRDNDGQIKVQVNGGWDYPIEGLFGYYNISLKTQEEFSDTASKYMPEEKVSFFGLANGKYTIYATDYGNCTISEDVTLNKYINPHVTSAVFDSVTCYGWDDGVIDTIKFETDCKVDGEPLELFCTKETGAPSNTANWIEYSPSIKNLTAGGYNIWLKDTNQCVSDEPFHIKVEQPDSLILSINDENNIIREYGKPGGSVNVNVSGGNKGTFNIYLDSKEDTLTQVIWGNHAFNDIFTPGTHKLYVTDHKECIDSATTKQMRQPDSPLSIEATPHDALCNGSFGSITVRGAGGWNGYQYSCSSKSNLYGANQNEYTFYDIKGGYYEVSVTDAEGVTATQKVYVNTPPKLMAVPLLRASSCKNGGLISANITGGTMPYLVKPDSSSVTPFYFEPYITNSNLTIIPKQLAAGDYSIIVVDSNNCEILMSATIADSSVKATVKPVYPTAHEFANGRLEAVVQQGPAPYTYQWKNHNTGQTCTNAVWDKVGAGVYSLDVTDANNCSVSVPITYLATNGDLPLIVDTIIGETAVGACNGMARFTSDTTGFKSITLHGNSGAEKDVTSLVNNKLQFELTGLAPDSYLLECVLADTTVRYAKFTIARYEPMHLIVSNIVDVSKQDAANGSAKLRIDGGRAPFIVQMLRGDDFLADTVLNDKNLPMSGLTAANYMVSVVDESDNRINTQFIIRKPEKPLRLLAQSVENPSCYGYTNGRIILKATGGWGDYEYAAAEGEFGRATAYDGRGAAVHTFVAIDSKGTTDTLKVELVEPLPLTARVVQVDSVSCFGLTDGSVTFDIAGGTAPYTVHYDDFFDKKSNFVGSLNAGTHTFNITDSNFCRAVEGSLAVDIPQPGVLQVASDSVVHTTCNTDNGRIFITIAGGTAPYANSWREDGLIKERFTNLIAIDSLQGYSLYEVEVADAKGCKTGKSYRINPSSGPKIERVRTLPVLCHGDSTGTAIIDSADIVPATPYSPFRIEWPHGENAMSVGNLPAGWNVVFIIDSNNCKNSTSFNIDAPSPIEIRKIGSRDASCYGYADGRISTLTLGGVGGYRYLWSNGDTLPDIDSIAKGAYTIVVADRNNCRDSAVFAIGQPDSLHVEIGEENVLMCPDNTYEFIPTDGFKTYRWILNDSTLSDKRNLIASEQGEYHLVATYGANCISRDTVTITIGDDLLEADFYMASDASKDNTIALVELSNMKTDSIRWEFSAADFDVMDSSLYELQLKPNTIGLHNITLWAYSSGCVSYITKQVEISELPDTTDNIKLGYDPLIKSVTVKPNPTNGLFRVDVQLRESHDAEMTISSVSHGTQIEQRELTGEAEYSESFDLSNAIDGVYILRIAAGNEQRLAKVLITK